MALLQTCLLPVSVTLADFSRRLGLSPRDLAIWLEMPQDRLHVLGEQPLPDPLQRTFVQECAAVACAVGCDAWSLRLLILWTTGRRY